MNNTKLSKFLSYVLRHNPSSIGLTLDPQGWTSVDVLIALAAKSGTHFTKAQLVEVVKTSDKQRFRLSDDGQQIRANQGHSISIDLGLEPVEPPEILYHGTAERFLPSIQEEGLRAGKRHHVHLSKEIETAIKVGQRHGQVIVLEIAAGQMHADGHQFFCSENGVWLTDTVAPHYFKLRS